MTIKKRKLKVIFRPVTLLNTGKITKKNTRKHFQFMHGNIVEYFFIYIPGQNKHHMTIERESLKSYSDRKALLNIGKFKNKIANRKHLFRGVLFSFKFQVKIRTT